MIPRTCAVLLRLAAFLVPSRSRAAWLRERSAELWYHELAGVRQGKTQRSVSIDLARRALSAFPDAFWRRLDRKASLDTAARLLRSPMFPIAAILALFTVVGLTSGGLSRTRQAVFGPPLGNGQRLVVVAVQERLLGWRHGFRERHMRRLRDNKSFEALSSFNLARSWITSAGVRIGRPMPHLLVTSNFFEAVGAGAGQGRVFSAAGEPWQPDMIVAGPALLELLDPARPIVGQTIELDGRVRRVAGVVPPGFWFLRHDLAAISVVDDSMGDPLMLGLGVLRPGISEEAAAEEMRQLARARKVETTLLADQLRAPFRIYGFGTLLLLTAVLAFSAVRTFRERRWKRYHAYLFVTATLGSLLVFTAVMEYSGAGALNATAGLDIYTEARAMFLWLVGTLLWLWWCLRDHRVRCRKCQTRLVMPVRIGLPGRVLFEHEGTELVCPKGHGTLFVEPTTESFRQSGRWMDLDPSWLDVFPTSR